MSREVVLFRSKTGYTFQYANWISQSLNCDVIENKKLDISEIKRYETIIIGGGIYADTVNGLDFLTKNWDALMNKKIFIFAVGSGEENIERMEQVWNRQLTSEQRKKVRCFYLRGGFDFSKLNRTDKMMMRIFIFFLKHSKNQTEETKELLEAYSKPFDFTSETSIVPLVEAVKKVHR